MKVPFGLKAFLFLVCATVLGLFVLPTEVESSRWLQVEGDMELIWGKVSSEEAWSQWNAAAGNDDWLSGRSIKISELDPKKWTVQYVIEDAMDNGTLQLQPLPENKGAWIKWIHTAKTGYSPLERLSQLSVKQRRSLAMDQSLERLADIIRKEANGQIENE